MGRRYYENTPHMAGLPANYRRIRSGSAKPSMPTAYGQNRQPKRDKTARIFWS